MHTELAMTAQTDLAIAAPKLSTELATAAQTELAELTATALAELAAVRKERRGEKAQFKTQQLGRKTQYTIILATRNSSLFDTFRHYSTFTSFDTFRHSSTLTKFCCNNLQIFTKKQHHERKKLRPTSSSQLGQGAMDS